MGLELLRISNTDNGLVLLEESSEIFGLVLPENEKMYEIIIKVIVTHSNEKQNSLKYMTHITDSWSIKGR